MKVVLIRHAKVNFKWKSWYTSEQFDKACKEYDQALITDSGYSAPEGVYSSYYISALPRTRETAQRIFGERDYIVTELINEVPLSAGHNSGIKLPLVFWNVSGRLQWYFNNPRQQEGRLQTGKRAMQFVNKLKEKNEDCVVVTHGFFMHTLVAELKREGFVVDNKSLKYDNGQCVIARL